MSYSPVLGNPKPQYEDSNGNPYVGMRLFFYQAGTSTKQDTKTTSAGSVNNTNPVVIDANGYPTGGVMIYGDDSFTYKVVAAPAGSDDPPTAPLWSIDNIEPTRGTLRADLATTTSTTLGAYLVGVFLSATGYVGRRLSAWIADRPYSVKDFGAIGDGTTDDTAAIQACIDAVELRGLTYIGGEVYFPPGKYRITATLNVTSTSYVSFLGVGRPSILLWDGALGGVVLDMGTNNEQAMISIEKLYFFHASTNYPICISLGDAVGPTGLVNVSIKKCMFQNVQTALRTYTETDQVTFHENWVLYYTVNAIHIIGASANSNYDIVNNHFQHGENNTWAVKHGGGANIRLDNNTVQSSYAGMAGFELTNIGAFSITKTYYEAGGGLGAGDGPFVSLINTSTGVIEGNVTTGNTGPTIYSIDATSSNIRIGPNSHGISGGTPTTAYAAASGATDIFIYGKFNISGGSFSVHSGVISAYAAGNFVYNTIPTCEYRTSQSVATSTTATLFTVAANTAYRVYAKNATEAYSVVGYVGRTGSGNAVLNSMYNTNGDLVLTVSGNDCQVINGPVGTRTIEWSAIRIF